MNTSKRKSEARASGLLLLGFGLLLSLTPWASAQERQEGPLQPKPPEEEEAPYALRVDVPVVNVDLTVTDRDGNFVAGLQKEHFRVYEDGVEQEVVAFAPSEAPLTTVLLVEASPALGRLLWDNLDAAYLFLNQLRKDDWVALVGYDMKPRLEVDFTRDRRAIVGALRQMQWGAGRFSEVNMFDALVDTLEKLKDVEGKKSIVVIGTGFNTFTRNTWDDTQKLARNTRTTIFCIGMQWPLELLYDRAESYGYRTGAARMDLNIAQAQMRELANLTGGRAYFPRFISELPSVYDAVGSMLRNQYSLAFRPKDFSKDGKFHKISVKLVGPNGEPLKVFNQKGKKVKYKVYARQGYYAPEA